VFTLTSAGLAWLAAATVAVAADDAAKAPAEPKAAEPFAFADFTWLNGNSRQQSPVFDGKDFTGEFFFDTNFIYDFNRPKDHTLDGSCEASRTNEFQVQQVGIGGDFHHDNVRGRLMTQFGMYSEMTPRNDASPSRGQWQLDNAYRYISEAYGGYHWDVWNGINVDAGIFMSYVGLFSYYNYENWAYQPSYVSANTPWFFNGVRIQTFPSDHLKLEYWIVNGFQAYGEFNEAPGLGLQVLYRPSGSVSVLGNQYYGHDTMNTPGRVRLHTDDSLEVKYLDAPKDFVSKGAFSLTLDYGCEEGDGVQCIGSTANTPNQSFKGFMFYNRLWFAKDIHAITVGGGAISNPGRYLVLLPPIQTPTPGEQGGATASNNTCANGNPCFSQNPGDQFKAWDYSVTYDYMPSQSITWRIEFDHRQASVPYFVGPGGITSPNGVNTTPQPPDWTPDLRTSENRINAALLVRF
jgi:hypothetical protein